MKSVDHVLILTPGFPKDEEDHLCIPPLQAYLEAMQQLHPEITLTVVSLHYPFEAGSYHWKGIPVFAMGGRNFRDPRRLLMWNKTLKTVGKIHKRQPISVLHSLWLQECTWLGQKLSKKHGFSHVGTLQGQDALSTNRYLKKLEFTALKVVALSDRGSQVLKENVTKSNPTVIPWGLRSTEMQWQMQDSKRSIDLLGVGSLVPVKRYDKFVRVVAALAEQLPDLRAVLVGTGSEEGHLRALVSELKLEKHIEFRGSLPRPEVLQLMEQSNIFLHPARYEGQGYVFLEALSRGMHLVSGPVGMAKAMDKWAVRDHTIGLAEASRQFLTAPVDLEPRNLLSMTDTVEAYLEIYAS